MADEFAARVSGVGSLAEPLRRGLYEYVAAQQDAVSREQAATACELALHTAKFHLDRLVDEGLLTVEFRRLSGRTGPGAGRPAKLYRRSDRELSVSLPERHYDVAGEILAGAVDRSERDGVPVGEAVREGAAACGRRLAADAGELSGSGLDLLAEVLGRHGYEPRPTEEELVLANCPFDRLAREHTELVCGMNLALVNGVVDGLGADSVEARLVPDPVLCCVRAREPERRASGRTEPGRRPARRA